MWELLLTMVERIGILVTIAFILTRFRFFRSMFYQNQLNRRQQFTAILFFGFFGIIGTYSGVSLSTENLEFHRWAAELTADEAIANSRVIGVVIASLLGGPTVGIGAGIIAGLHRFTLGGFTAIACGLATIIASILASLFYKKHKRVRLQTAFIIGALAESLQMLIILMIAQPFEQASALVNIIGIPMILANGLGSALFLLVIKNVLSEEEKVSALQAQKTLRIADQTISHLQHGLTPTAAEAVCHIIHQEIQTSAVSITNRSEILAHVGLGHDHHRTNSPIQTKITLDAIQQGKVLIANQESIHCAVTNCPLGAAVIAPLRQCGKTIGTLKFYFRSEKEITNVTKELIKGLSSMISHQLETAEVDRAYQLAKEAEIKALQAQIRPHFLFNTLNTIISLIRLDPGKARKMLVSLSHFLRQNLSATTQSTITLQQELAHVKAYLSIKEERFKNKLTVSYEIDPCVLNQLIPPLTLQPIIENAMKHGFKDKETDCLLKIKINRNQDRICIYVADNGKGMSTELAEQVIQAPIDSASGSGLALYNVNRRLSIMFGEDASLQISSSINQGTAIQFSIPYKEMSQQWIS
ncbi:sensor histidine kinase [Agaribacter marinus]|uniref:histidine kinase n=1 Tax=Virgibacillus salarius TaxID=447199 RepID=A0A941IB79_9BACI|nr:sensor histidine kinase [uncultured Virgibacillus sp.]MBR7796127.1 sensor histidine kinase [Virgibacillus salarius]NAZ08836.1 sensor histidine kinase [Agaribacter marinus]